MARSGEEPGNKPAIARVSGQEQPQSGIRTADDQLDVLLREFDDASESNRKTAREKKAVTEKQAAYKSNNGKLRSVNRQLLDLAAKQPRTNASEQALIWSERPWSFPRTRFVSVRKRRWSSLIGIAIASC
jgi:hypothetical protein